MADVLSGLEYLHNAGVCHLDLKADNILLSESNSAVISDFGAMSRTDQPADKYVKIFVSFKVSFSSVSWMK